MKITTYLQQSSNLFAANQLLRFLVIVLCACLVGTTYLAYRAVRLQRVILIPPHMTGTVEFVQGRPSDDYLREIGQRVVSLATTYSPHTARRQFNELLVYYAPEAYAEASARWYSLAGRIEDRIAQRLNVLAHVVWQKPTATGQKCSKEALRAPMPLMSAISRIDLGLICAISRSVAS